MDISLCGTICIILIIIITIKIYYESDIFQLKCIVSNVDGNNYCVRERERLEEAADHLANVSKKLNILVDDCKKNFPDQENVKKLIKGYNPEKIVEILPTSKYVAYSENKGEKLAFCLETEKENGKGKLIDLNTLTFVAIHELAHICTVSIGHTEEFWNNFKFLLQRAVKLKIYNPIDYKEKPIKYCGKMIKDNPYYDL